MENETQQDHQPVSRRSFFGAAAVTVGAGTVLAPYALAKAASEAGKSQVGQTSTKLSAADTPVSPGAGAKPAAPHITSLANKQPSFAGPSGSLSRVDANDMPRMKRLSIRRLLLASRGVREPHWHANAHELGYCLRGDHLVTIAGSHSTRNSFTISPGEMFFVPSGALHHVENVGAEEGEIVLAFSHEKPEDFSLSGTFGAFSDAVLGNTFGMPASAFANLNRTLRDTGINSRETATAIELQDKEINPYKYSLQAALPQINSNTGTVHLAHANVWPNLQDLAMFKVDLTHQGMRELHWHPETAEMGYVTHGRGRMTILSPGGSLETYEMNPGDVYFIPPAYPHHIEDLGEDDLKLLIFFDQTKPGDIGMRSAVPSFSKDVVAASFKTSVSQLPDIPFVAQDTLIVERINPVDPISRY
jgi:oxalate decarboxylase